MGIEALPSPILNITTTTTTTTTTTHRYGNTIQKSYCEPDEKYVNWGKQSKKQSKRRKKGACSLHASLHRINRVPRKEERGKEGEGGKGDPL